jgi:UDP-N-acetylglucosamine--N-acetylmuramyl-(pentapeptide) pyrophosphoryl-undecaprenol N-acetylglucosamine transferase
MPDDAEALNLAGGRALFVASTGGHLTELLRLAPAMNAAPDSQWVTFDSEQSRSALRGAHFSFVPYVRPRDYRGTLATVGLIRRTIRRMKPVAVISTGSGVAIGAFIAARLQRVPCYYIESVSRVDGPSLTGRIVAGLHLAHLRTQHATWADERWKPYPSVLSDFESVPAPDAPDRRREPSLFVTLGTIQPYRFDALVEAVLATGLADERTVWQVGSTTRQDLPGRVVYTK